VNYKFWLLNKKLLHSASNILHINDGQQAIEKKTGKK
jgi:hypothetical protein